MADEETTEEEPSIEEILDSIRQIISDDDDEAEEGVSDSPTESSSEPAVADSEDDVIELNDPVDEPTPEPDPEPAPEPEPEPEETPPEPESVEDIFGDTVDDEDELDIPEVEPEPFDVDMQDAQDEDDNILAGIAESAAMDGFEKLVKKTAVEYNGITIEEIVRSELKPLLREWLDDNLPSMIERLVQEELERVSKRVLGDN